MISTSIFFAIPCGEYYGEQAKIIRRICGRARIKPIIIEHDVKTSELWNTIIDQIEQADYFVADVSSLRPNIVLELGYALKAKHESHVAFLISRNVDAPSDLIGKKRLEYSGFSDFQSQLIEWLVKVVGVNRRVYTDFNRDTLHFHDEFQDFDRFLRLWSFPPGCDFSLTSEGLRFTNAHMPILSKTLGILSDFEFTFTGRVGRDALGWVIKGTPDLSSYYPQFCIMFNTNLRELRAHILNVNQIHPQSLYQPFTPQPVNLQVSREGWFTITTRGEGDVVTILNEGRVIFRANFATETPYSSFYNFRRKLGEIGFRCHPGEEAIIRQVEVREL